MDRRDFLALLAVGGAAALTGCTSTVTGQPTGSSGPAVATGPAAPPSPAAHPVPAARPLEGALPTRKHPLPAEPITALPGRGRHLALTVDDGASAAVVGAYCRWAVDSGARFTFFVTAQYESWRENRALLRPLVESGQVQLGNHTWSHPSLTSLSAAGVADELRRCERFLRNEFGVSGAPYFRPPFGYRNAAVDAVAADLGYTMPTLWDGSLSDSGVVTEKFLIGAARQYFRAQRVVIGHANHEPVTHVYGKFTDIIRHRKLQTVTLNDYFAR